LKTWQLPREIANSRLAAIDQWRYTPSTVNGEAIDSRVYILIRADHGHVCTAVVPDLQYPTEPRRSIAEQISSGELFPIEAGRVETPKVIYAPNLEYSELARMA
jgi:hypothetical protein